jgi:hypothetical protein
MSPDGLSSSESRPTSSAKSLLEPRVVAYGREVVVSARVLAEPRQQLDGPTEMSVCLRDALDQRRPDLTYGENAGAYLNGPATDGVYARSGRARKALPLGSGGITPSSTASGATPSS